MPFDPVGNIRHGSRFGSMEILFRYRGEIEKKQFDATCGWMELKSQSHDIGHLLQVSYFEPSLYKTCLAFLTNLAPDLGRQRMRNALGQNIDNSLVSQDILERIVPPYRTYWRGSFHHIAPTVDHQEDNEANEALIRNLDSVSVATAPPIPPSTLIQRKAS
ncbi:hypothetical protein OSTOST_18405 [Ostertagia ostertagi]